MFLCSFSIAIQKYPCKVKRNWKYINNTYTHHFGDYLNLYIITFCGVILKYIQVINVFKTNLRFFITIIYFVYPCVKIWLNRVHPIKPVTCLLLFVPISFKLIILQIIFLNSDLLRSSYCRNESVRISSNST